MLANAVRSLAVVWGGLIAVAIYSLGCGLDGLWGPGANPTRVQLSAIVGNDADYAQITLTCGELNHTNEPCAGTQQACVRCVNGEPTIDLRYESPSNPGVDLLGDYTNAQNPCGITQAGICNWDYVCVVQGGLTYCNDGSINAEQTSGGGPPP